MFVRLVVACRLCNRTPTFLAAPPGASRFCARFCCDASQPVRAQLVGFCIPALGKQECVLRRDKAIASGTLAKTCIPSPNWSAKRRGVCVLASTSACASVVGEGRALVLFAAVCRSVRAGWTPPSTPPSCSPCSPPSAAPAGTCTSCAPCALRCGPSTWCLPIPTAAHKRLARQLQLFGLWPRSAKGAAESVFESILLNACRRASSAI